MALRYSHDPDETDEERERYVERVRYRKRDRENIHKKGDTYADVANTGKVYIPLSKVATMSRDFEDKSGVEYQRLMWDSLRKSINGLINKANATNIKYIIFSENLVTGRGLFRKSCLNSQMASPDFTDVFAALVAVVNTKFPQIGYLLLKRIVLQLQRAYKRNDTVSI